MIRSLPLAVLTQECRPTQSLTANIG